jgi:hypothetical protein
MLRTMAAPEFKDHFSRLSAGYSLYRPSYPHELIEYVAVAPARFGAWLSTAPPATARQPLHWPVFERVVAVGWQRKPARQGAGASSRGLPVRMRGGAARWADGSVSLICGQRKQYHWFDFGRFNEECRRVLVRAGVVGRLDLRKIPGDTDIDARLGRFLPRRRRVRTGRPNGAT